MGQILRTCHRRKSSICEPTTVIVLGFHKVILAHIASWSCELIFGFDVFQENWVFNTKSFLGLVQILGNPLAGIEGGTDRDALLLFKDDVFLDKAVDIFHNFFDVDIDFHCLLF